MKFTKIFTVSTFLLAFAVCVSAQASSPKIVWKNLQEKYERFEDVEPVIINDSNQPIYFDCTLSDFEKNKMSSYVERSDNTKLLYFDEERNRWDWNVMICGTVSKGEREEVKKKYKEIERLQKEANYVPAGCKINPNEKFALSFSEIQWSKLTRGDGIGPTYKFGKFKFEINYWWYNSRKDNGSKTAESPKFWITPKQEAN